MNIQEAKQFCSTRRWVVTEPPHKDNYCNHCEKAHPFAVDIITAGVIHRFWSEQEFIDWVVKLKPNSV